MKTYNYAQIQNTSHARRSPCLGCPNAHREDKPCPDADGVECDLPAAYADSLAFGQTVLYGQAVEKFTFRRDAFDQAAADEIAVGHGFVDRTDMAERSTLDAAELASLLGVTRNSIALIRSRARRTGRRA